jgi:hypothetical protein
MGFPDEDVDSKQRKKRGRPREIELPRLYGQRDTLVQLFASNWEKIALQVDRFRRVKSAGLPEVRKTFASLTGENGWHVLSSILGHPTEIASSIDIRRSRKQLASLLVRKERADKQWGVVRERLQAARRAFKQAAAKERESIKPELRHRCRKVIEGRLELDAARNKVDDLQRKLAMQEAYFAQNEVLRFMKSGRNRLDPKRLADAMAGLPRLGRRQSSRLCAKQPCSVWPHFHYMLIKELERIWMLVNAKNRASATELFRSEIVAPPKKSRGENLIQIRTYLCQNWRYVRLAIGDCLTRKIGSRELPFEVMTVLSNLLAQPRNDLERLLAEQEALIG